MLFYFYKITNLINGKYYFGVHRTNNINDGYMGSGVAINRALRKYGVSNFRKEILKYFDTENEMYNYEEMIVDEREINNEQCYNMILGGRGTKSHLSMEKYIDKEKMKRIRRRYWETGDVEAKRKAASEKQKAYLKNADPLELKAAHKNISKGLQKLWSSPNSEILREERRKSSQKYWNYHDSLEERKIHGEKVIGSVKYQEGMKRYQESGAHKGYNNPDFKARWKKIYEEESDVIVELLKYSNLPESFIFEKLFPEKNVKYFRVLEYYEYLNLLQKPIKKEKQHRFLKFDNCDDRGHKDGGSVKTVYCEECKYHFVFLYEDFFQQFENILKIVQDDSISDSMIVNSGKSKYGITNYFQVISYFFEIGFINNVRKKTIRTRKTVKGSSFTVPSQKTVFDIEGKTKVTLVDKEFNKYEIDENGRPFQNGRFVLSVNGKERILRCI